MKSIRLFFLALSMSIVVMANSLASDVDLLKTRLSDFYIETINTDESGAHSSSQNSNGSWPDINYGDKSRTDWDPMNHLYRLKSMSAAYNNPLHTQYQNGTLLAGILDGINYWYSVGPTSNNWWYNDIGKQLQLGPVGILMEGRLSSSQKNNIINDMPPSPSMTGQNRVWLAQGTIWRGCLENSTSRINTGLDAIKSTVYVTTNEGIQADNSFHQHGPQIYNGGYGKAYIDDVTLWIYLTRDTSFAFGTDKVDIMSRLILDGSQWMVRKNYWDPGVTGRELSRVGRIASTSSLVRACERMAALNTDRKGEFQGFLEHLNGKNTGSLTGNKHFWRSDYHAHRRSNYYTSVRMFSTRAYSQEAGNGENLQGYYLPTGANYIHVDGDEYFDIFPIWDWGHIPGTTSPHKDPAPEPKTWGGYGTKSFVGGASNGKYGVAGFNLSWDGVTGKKAWFFFDDEYVALGAGITSSSSTPINTTVNQTFSKGSVDVEYELGTGTPTSDGTFVLKNPNWVHHNQVGYVFPNNENVMLKNANHSGSWSEINTSTPSTIITDKVFSLWFDHGATPSGASYEYIVLPGYSKSKMQSYANSVPLKIVSNNTVQQAVHHTTKQLVGIVFHAAGTITVSNSLSIAADQPCILLYDYSVSPSLVTVSNPNNASITVNVTINSDSRAFSLPSGSQAGSSVTMAMADDTSGEAPPAPDGTYNFKEDFSGMQGLNQWYYQYHDGSYKDMTYDSPNTEWDIVSDEYPYIKATSIHPGAGHDAVLKWVAPKDGEVTISGEAKKANLDGGDGIKVKILKNSVQLWPSSDWQFIAYDNATGYAHNVTTSVNAGDAIYFIVNAVSTQSHDGVSWSPIIEYMDKPNKNFPVINSVSGQSDDAPAEGLIDGDLHATNADARWSADGMPQSVIIDYGENKSFIGTKLYTYKNRAYQYKVELSEDLDFSGDLVVDRLSNTSSGQPITDNFSAVTARYAKITVTGAAAYTGSWVSLIEFEIVEGTSNEIPEGYPVINSFSKEAGDGPATNLIDDNTDGVSRWSANTFPQWIIVDYGAVVPMTGTQVWTYQNRAYKYKVELSEDLDFTNDLVVDRLSNTEAGQPIADNFAAVNARYAKITVTGASGYSGTWSSLTEFKVLLDGGLMSTASSLPPVASATRISSDPAIVVYPNPAANGEFEIRGLEDGAIVTVHSLLGVKLMEKTAKGNSLKLNLANAWGTVHVSISQNGTTTWHKVIVQ